MPDLSAASTVLKILRQATDRFQQEGIDSPRVAAEILLARAIGCRRIDLYLAFDRPLSDAEQEQFRVYVQRRLHHEPVAYITGQREFWSLPLTVAPSVLIPRPDTECLVEAALAVLPRADSARRNVLDLGTGSGALALALAKERPGHRFCATDISPAAIGTAKINARRLGLTEAINFIAGDWFAPLFGQGCWDLIVCNPPYITASELTELAPEVKSFEPRQALDGGADGLDHLRRLVFEAPAYLATGGYLMLEIGSSQRLAIEALAREMPDYDSINFRLDYAGRDRVACLRRSKI